MESRAGVIKDGCDGHGLFEAKEYMVNSDDVVFIFTAMGTKRRWMYVPFVGRMNKLGYSCIVYDYDLGFLFSPTFNGWKNFFDLIIADARARLMKYEKQGRKNFFAYGVSMGTLIANKFTRDTKEVSHLILNLTYGDVAENIWTCRLVRKVKRAFEGQGVSEETLRNNIKYMDPIASADGLKNKKVLLQLSKNDHVLRYRQTQKTRQALENAVINFKYEEKKVWGHYAAGAINLMSTKKIDGFYRDKL